MRIPKVYLETTMMNNTIEKEINKIRIDLNEETKNLSPQQMVSRANEANRRAVEKYGFKIVSKKSL